MTDRVVAEEAAGLDVHLDRPAGPGQVPGLASIVAVDTRASSSTGWAVHPAAPGLQVQDDALLVKRDKGKAPEGGAGAEWLSQGRFLRSCLSSENTPTGQKANSLNPSVITKSAAEPKLSRCWRTLRARARTSLLACCVSDGGASTRRLRSAIERLAVPIRERVRAGAASVDQVELGNGLPPPPPGKIRLTCEAR